LEIPFLKILIIKVEITAKYYIVASYVALGATQQSFGTTRQPYPFRGMSLSSSRGF
jgi:hypothetical protein